MEDAEDFDQAMKALAIRAGVLLALVLSLVGCVDAHFGLANLMAADRSPRTAILPQGYTVEDVTIQHGERVIGVTYARHPQSRAVIVFCGGNSFHRSIEGGEALATLAQGADVVLFDYPGYGDSSGPATPATILEDALAVYDNAVAVESSRGKTRVLYGFSLGGMVAAQVAGKRAVDGLVLEATAPNVDAWVRSQIPWYAKLVVRPRIEPELAGVDTVSALRGFSGEVLVMASVADGAKHGGIPRAPEYAGVLAAFLDRVAESK